MTCRGVQITRTIEIESTIPHDANSAASACPSMDDTVDGRRSCSWTRSLLRTELGSRGYTVHRTGRRVSGFVWSPSFISYPDCSLLFALRTVHARSGTIHRVTRLLSFVFCKLSEQT